jgi:hypothetical protein
MGNDSEEPDSNGLQCSSAEKSFSWKGIPLMHKDNKNSRALHRNWKVWCAVILMLAAVLMYVVTLDDSVVPVFFK